MADFTVPSGAVGIYRKTLSPNTVDTVKFADDVDEVEVIGDGVAEIYVTVDGGTPEIAGQWAWLLPAVFSVRSLSSEANGLPTVVQLISDGAPTYHVLRSR